MPGRRYHRRLKINVHLLKCLLYVRLYSDMIKMKSVLNDYSLDGENQYLYIFPVERLKIKNKEKVGDVSIYPAGYLDIDELLKNVFYLDNEEKIKADEQLKIFKNNTLLVFSDEAFQNYPLSVVSDEQIIKKAYQKVDFIIDFLKFKYCHFSNSKNLPSRLGQISTGETLLLFMDHMAVPRIINKTVFNNTLTIGNGLKIQEDKIFDDFKLFNHDIAEVGNIAKNALKIYSSALEESSDTNKFIQIMRLFEFIAFPEESRKFEKVKEQILSHVAKNNNDAIRIREEFKAYTGGNNNNGLRTEIIHNGKFLEDIGIYQDSLEREYLFDKLQKYLHFCINDLIESYNKSWSDIEQIREDKKKLAEKNKQKSNEENCAKSIVIIDADWLSESIQKYTKIYGEIYPNKNFKKIKCEEFFYHILANTRTLEIDRVFLFYVFFSKLESISHFEQDIVNLDKKNLRSDKLIFQFHIFNLSEIKEMINGISKVVSYVGQDKLQNSLHFKNIVFCGDRTEYTDVLRNTISNGNQNIIAIRDSYIMEMNIDVPFFHVGRLIGFSLGLAQHEL